MRLNEAFNVSDAIPASHPVELQFEIFALGSNFKRDAIFHDDSRDLSSPIVSMCSALNGAASVFFFIFNYEF